MDTVVDKLLSVDKEARMILDEAQQYYEKTLQETEEEKKKVLAKFKQKGHSHITDVENLNSIEAAETIENNKNSFVALSKSMEQIYTENSEKWERELFERCWRR